VVRDSAGLVQLIRLEDFDLSGTVDEAALPDPSPAVGLEPPSNSINILSNLSSSES